MSPLVVIIIIAALIAAAGAFIAVWSFTPRGVSEAELAQSRLLSYAGHPRAATVPGAAPEPFRRRVLDPVFGAVTRALGSRLRGSSRAALQRELLSGGRPFDMTPEQFSTIRYVAGILSAGGGLGVGVAIGQPLVAALLALAGIIAGFFGPMIWLRILISRRRRRIAVALPNALDLLSVSVEAGLGFDAAMSRVVDQYENPLTEEFAQVLGEMRLGRPRSDALEDMGRRAGVLELNNFIRAVIQSQAMGTAIAPTLRAQSDELRRKRRQRAQVLGAQAPLKMLLPMLGCIFPTLWVLLLGPALILVLGTCSGFRP